MQFEDTLLHLIEKRCELRRAERRLSLPEVISEEDLALLGEHPPTDRDGDLDAFVLSNGTCTGPVRIVHSLQQAGDLGKGYVLVCPSTDPSWTPLFVNACGVVLERGGTLSHGAIVAREMGLPAVVLAGATQRLTEGDCDLPIQITAEKPLDLADSSNPEQRIFLVRPTLEKYYQDLQSTSTDLADMAWDQALPVKHYRQMYLEELRGFLAGKMPDQTRSWEVLTPSDQSGKWPINLWVPDVQTVVVFAVLGEGFAPESKEDITVKLGRRERTDRQVQLWRSESSDLPIKEVQVRYRNPNPIQGEGTFWKPLDWFESNEDTGPIMALLPPWLVLYILVYVVVMFAAKAVLRIA